MIMVKGRKEGRDGGTEGGRERKEEKGRKEKKRRGTGNPAVDRFLLGTVETRFPSPSSQRGEEQRHPRWKAHHFPGRVGSCSLLVPAVAF